MSQKMPRLTAKELVTALKRLGFYEHHQKGSHLILKHPVKICRVTIPMHTGKTLKLGTLKSILEQAEVTVDDIVQLYLYVVNKTDIRVVIPAVLRRGSILYKDMDARLITSGMTKKTIVRRQPPVNFNISIAIRSQGPSVKHQKLLIRNFVQQVGILLILSTCLHPSVPSQDEQTGRNSKQG